MIIYEGVFLNKEEVECLFKLIRGEKPHSKTPKDYHVTTTFRPDCPSPWLYGKKVSVHITGYKDAEIATHEGMTYNEGLRVELFSDDPDMTGYIVKHPCNFHITGSFEDKPVYTGFIDFSDSQNVDCTFIGTFGAFDSDGNIIKTKFYFGGRNNGCETKSSRLSA